MEVENVNRFLANLIKEVAKLRRQQMEYDTIWVILGKKYGVDYRPMWDELQAEAKLRFKLLWQEGDSLMAMPPSQRPTEEHWKLLTQVMVMEDDNTGSCTQNAEHVLLCLLVEAAMDVTSRVHLPLWYVIEQRYTTEFISRTNVTQNIGPNHTRGRICPAVVLQRRFVRWLTLVRAVLRSRWTGLLLAAQGSEPPLYLPAVIRYSQVMASGQCQWSNFLNDGLVVDSSDFEVEKLLGPEKGTLTPSNISTYKQGFIILPIERQTIGQLDRQNDSSDDETLNDSNSDGADDKLHNVEDSDDESQSGINGKLYKISTKDEVKFCDIKIETEDEKFLCYETEIEPHQPVSPEQKVFVDCDSLHDITISDLDRGQPIPTLYFKLLLSSVNKPCMLVTCCLSRKLLLLREHGCFISDHVRLDCNCCCDKFGSGESENNYTILPLTREPQINVIFSFITSSKAVEDILTPATEFNSVCHLSADTFVNSYGEGNEIISLESGVLWKVDRYLIVTSSNIQNSSLDLANLYTFSDPGMPIRKITFTGKIKKISSLIVKDEIDLSSEANTMFCSLQYEERDDGGEKLYKTYVPLPVKYLTMKTTHDLYDVYLIDLSTRAVLPVDAVYTQSAVLSVHKTGATPDMRRWKKNNQLKKRVKVNIIRKDSEKKTYALTGELFAGPGQRIVGTNRIRNDRMYLRGYKQERLLDLYSMNFLPRMLPHERMPNLSTALSAANRKLLLTNVDEREATKVERNARSARKKYFRVNNTQKYRIWYIN